MPDEWHDVNAASTVRWTSGITQVATLRYTASVVGYVEENEAGQGPDAPLEGEPRQASQHGPRLTATPVIDDVVPDRPADQA